MFAQPDWHPKVMETTNRPSIATTETKQNGIDLIIANDREHGTITVYANRIVKVATITPQWVDIAGRLVETTVRLAPSEHFTSVEDIAIYAAAATLAANIAADIEDGDDSWV